MITLTKYVDYGKITMKNDDVENERIEDSIAEGVDDIMPTADIDTRNCITQYAGRRERTQSQPIVEIGSEIDGYKGHGGLDIAEIRVHGRGNMVVMSYYPSDSKEKPYKFYASSKLLEQAIENEIPVWVDERRLSKIQLASVKRALESVASGVMRINKVRDGRSMILVKKKK